MNLRGSLEAYLCGGIVPNLLCKIQRLCFVQRLLIQRQRERFSVRETDIGNYLI